LKKAIGVLLVHLLMLSGSVAAWAAPPGNVRFLVTGRVEDPSATFIASGAINGVGTLTAEWVDYRQADNTYHETDLAAVGGGTLTLSVDGRFDVWPFALDPRTCTQRGTLSGIWTVTAGGGDFAGATGSGTFSGHFLTYANRTPDGCDEKALKGFLAGPMVGNVRFTENSTLPAVAISTDAGS
jgi:hypothetical protein